MYRHLTVLPFVLAILVLGGATLLINGCSTKEIKTAAACHPDLAPDCENWRPEALETEAGSYSYSVYAPSSTDPKPRPLVVMLHGCLQDALTFALSTRMNHLAEQNGFIVLYPQQRQEANPAKCWNWFAAAQQVRDGSEASIILQMVAAVRARHAVDERRIHVAGISAGGAMTSLLLSCHPDIFASGAIHSGVAYAAASDMKTATNAMSKGPTLSSEKIGDQMAACAPKSDRRSVSALIIHGKSDKVAVPENADTLARAFLRYNDHLDDGRINKSFPTSLRDQSYPAEEGNGYGWHLTEYGNQQGVVVAKLRIQELDHAWSGGNPEASFTDAKGPVSSELIWRFFKDRSR